MNPEKPSIQLDRFVLKFISILILFILILVAGKFLYPEVTNKIIQVIWYITVGGVLLFALMGGMVVIGKRKEVNKVLDLLLEGSLTFVDIITYLRELREQIKLWIKKVIIALAPLFSYAAAFFIYAALIFFYKWVGKSMDVTPVTVFLTMFLIIVLGLFNKPAKDQENPKFSWTYELKNELKSAFLDGLEVVTFIFFITMDRENLFFLPESLKIPLKAQIGEYDLILQGYHSEGFRTTLTLIAVAVGSEVVRIISKMLVIARKYYDMSSSEDLQSNIKSRLKDSIRKSFNDNRRQILKFIAFNTLLLIVFLAFPRLKILSLAIASTTGLIMDLVTPGRLTFNEGEDLLNRIFSKVVHL